MRWADVKSAVFAVTQLVYINLVGRLMVSELIALLGFLFIKKLKLIRKHPQIKTILIGFTLFLFALVISDLFNETVQEDYLRGWSSVVFSVISTIFLISQFEKSSNAPYIYLIASGVAVIFLTPGELDITILVDQSNYFKVKFAPIFTPLVAVFSCFLWNIGRRQLSAILILLSGAIFMMFDARSAGAGLIIAAFLLLAQAYNTRPKLTPIILSSILIGSASYASYVYYVDQVLYEGLGGSNAQQILKVDNPYNPFELLLEGRTSLAVAAKAIEERPLLGFGSWAKDETGEYSLLMAALKDAGNFEHHLGIIPVHSVMLAAWVWAGFIGFIGMGLVAITMFRLFLISYWVKLPITPALNIYFVSFVWALFFSPIGSIRTTFPFIIALLITSAYHVKGQPSSLKQSKLKDHTSLIKPKQI